VVDEENSKEEKEQSFEEWLAGEQARLDEGFKYTPGPSTAAGPSTGDDVLAGLGLGAGIAGGAVAPHPNPVTFEGCQAHVIAAALQAEIPDDDTYVRVARSGDSTVVTVFTSPSNRPYDQTPALSATLLEADDTLTVTMGELSREAKREALSSIGGTIARHGSRILRGGGIGGLLDAAGSIIEGVSDVADDVDDLTLPRRVWNVIDRVGGAAEIAYLEEQRRLDEAQRKREAAERAWTHCPSCGRAYEQAEAARMNCSSCGGPRGPKPAWM
jgi:hypothetical protein